MKEIKLHSDSPQLLVARSSELNLSDPQQQGLSEIVLSARERARNVLTEEQREKLGPPTEQPKSVMEIAKMRMQEKKEGKDKQQMCPMCTKMMKDKMKEKAILRGDTNANEGQASDR